jgi:hypothetical protein
MYLQYLLCKIPGEIPMEFSSPTPYPAPGRSLVIVIIWNIGSGGKMTTGKIVGKYLGIVTI